MKLLRWAFCRMQLLTADDLAGDAVSETVISDMLIVVSHVGL